jgi:hypothetical protein
MPKAKWVITGPTGKAAVYDKADLDRRKKEAEKAGVTLDVRKV